MEETPKVPLDSPASRIDGNSFSNAGNVNINVQGAQNIDQRTITYEAAGEDHGIIPMVAALIERVFGDKAQAVQWTVGGAAIIDLLLIIKTPTALDSAKPTLIYLLVGLILLFSTIQAGLSYEQRFTCNRCHTRYALTESKAAMITETTRADGVHRLTTRYYKCRECRHESTNVSESLISADGD